MIVGFSQDGHSPHSGEGPAHTAFDAWIALGGNLAHGDSRPSETLLLALERIAARIAPPTAVSRFFRTPAHPAGSGPDFVNAVARLQVDQPATPAQARDLLAALHAIEADLGRARLERWGPRTVDLDLLALGGLVLPDAATQGRWRGLSAEAQLRETPAELILPHPRIAGRAFVLVPLADLAPGWRDPATGQSAAQMLAALPEAALAGIAPL